MTYRRLWVETTGYRILRYFLAVVERKLHDVARFQRYLIVIDRIKLYDSVDFQQSISEN